MAKPRGRVIDDGVIEVIEHIVDQWTGKLTWELLIAAVKAAIATKYTRQALAKHTRIAKAFSDRKESLAKEQGRPQPKDARTQALLKTIDTLKAENTRLENECAGYRAKFVRWTQNAVIKGLTEAQLDATLPPAARDSTEKKVISLSRGRKARDDK